MRPASRAWDYTMKIRGGVDVRVSGAQVPGGRITVDYTPGVEVVAADAGDYIYPSDVRLDRGRERLYINADGQPAARGGPQT